MKTTFKTTILLFVILIILVFMINIPFNQYNNETLYSEKSILQSTNNSLENKEYITREKAVERTLEVFKNSFDIELNRNELSENVNLYENEDGCEWIIRWDKKGSEARGESYFCNILADTGEIKSIGVNIPNQIEYYKKYKKIDEKKAKEIIKPLAKELKINIENMQIYIDYTYKYSRRVCLINSNNNSYFYDINIDKEDEKLLNFSKVKR